MNVKSYGFTLIELLMVVALLGIAAGFSSDIVLTLVRSYNKTQIQNEIEQNANFTELKLEKELRDAQFIDIANTNATQLVFTNQSNIQITYKVENGVLKRKVATGSFIDLTNTASIGGVSVSCTQCFLVLSSPNPYVVHINITFKQSGNPQATFTGATLLDTTVVVRGTY